MDVAVDGNRLAERRVKPTRAPHQWLGPRCAPATLWTGVHQGQRPWIHLPGRPRSHAILSSPRATRKAAAISRAAAKRAGGALDWLANSSSDSGRKSFRPYCQPRLASRDRECDPRSPRDLLLREADRRRGESSRARFAAGHQDSLKHGPVAMNVGCDCDAHQMQANRAARMGYRTTMR